MQSNYRKRHRTLNHRNFNSSATATRLSSTAALIDSSSDKTVTEASQTLRRSSSFSSFSSTTSFNDPTTADVLLHLTVDSTHPFIDDNADDEISVSNCSLDVNNLSSDVQIHVHSHILTRAKYFSALLSERWRQNKVESNSKHNNLISIKLTVPPVENSINNHLTVLKLLYMNDFTEVITSPSIALNILPVALELLFEDCVKGCIKFLEAVPWSLDEEQRVIGLIPLLSETEAEELLARVRVSQDDNKGDDENNSNLCEEMLYGLILSAMHIHTKTAFVKAFVAKLLRDFSNRESARNVLERAFQESLKVVKESLEEYASPDFRGGGDYDGTEAIQRVNLHTALTNGKHLLWVVERMIELKVADNAVKEWGEQSGFTGDLQRAFRDDAWRNIVPGLPAVVLRCTARLANAVASGSILAATQVRMKLVKDWLPVLIVCKDNVPPISPSHKSLYLELEETFLTIISTLPMSDAQELLQQCLSFSTRNVEDCLHLVTAFNTWFRRAMRPAQWNSW